jgi:phosphonate transport system substrate-binding protein
VRVSSRVFFLALPLLFCLIFAKAGHCQEVTEDEKKVFLIGLTPERNIFEQIERYQPLADYLSEKTRLKVKLKVFTRYGNMINYFVSSHMDAAFFGSFSYVLAHEKLGVEAIARPVSLDGTSTYFGKIFVRKDSGIKGPREMKGKRFVFVDKATTAGYLLPLLYFKERGIKDYQSYLREVYFAGTHEDAIYDVLNGKADIGAAKNTVFDRIAKTDRRILTDLEEIERSPEVPENTLAVTKHVSPSVRAAIEKALLGMENDPEGRDVLKKFGAQRFIRTSNADYESLYALIRKIGLNLAQYDYVNSK